VSRDNQKDREKGRRARNTGDYNIWEDIGESLKFCRNLPEKVSGMEEVEKGHGEIFAVLKKGIWWGGFVLRSRSTMIHNRVTWFKKRGS